MSNQEILKKAIQKAIDGGWKIEHRGSTLWSVKELADFIANGTLYDEWALLIFNHDFAKALWGEKEIHHIDLVNLDDSGTTTSITKPIWQYHLQQMVKAEDPIQYLGEHL